MVFFFFVDACSVAGASCACHNLSLRPAAVLASNLDSLSSGVPLCVRRLRRDLVHIGLSPVPGLLLFEFFLLFGRLLASLLLQLFLSLDDAGVGLLDSLVDAFLHLLLDDVQQLPLLLEFVVCLTNLDVQPLRQLVKHLFVQLGLSQREELALVGLGVESLVLIPNDLFHLSVLVPERLHLRLHHRKRRQYFAVQVFEVVVEGEPGLLVLQLVEGPQLGLLVQSPVDSSNLSS